ncbi:fumarylacetoacetate hydrolase family protein [Kangiella marina]|uniref:Fumarylacetoacetate hydrolase family protein n=2 Tax=Kangiella marina TaxID=1079178 RepID=A0ABP8IJB1_9GAMM
MLVPSDEEKLMQDAYSLQRVSVLQHAINDPIVGYKAGLTSEKGQEAFNVGEPLVGALFRSGFSRNRGAYILGNYHDLRLEVELGYILKRPITQPVEADQLSHYIKAIVPIVELPNLRFARKDEMTAATLITSNVGSNHFIMGNTMAYEPDTVNQLTTSLSKNGTIIMHGKATDAMGDQQEALVWMINKLLAIGYPLNQDNLLITGALGTMLPAEKGQYEARFRTDAMEEHETYIIAFSIR